MSGWAKQGWDDIDNTEYSEDENKQWGPRRFWMPAEATKRVLFLDGDPFCFHEHEMWNLNKSRDRHVCLDRNKIDPKGCPLCMADLYPTFIGYFTIINMGDVLQDEKGRLKLQGWHSEKTNRTYQFQKELYGAKRGSKKKPGTLKQLQRLAQKRGGNLSGTVWDIYRSGSGASNVGDEFDFIEKIAEQDWEAYLVGEGAEQEQLQKAGLVPFDYTEEFKPKTYDELQTIVSGVPSKPNYDSTGSGARSEGAGYGSHIPADDDGDIPF